MLTSAIKGLLRRLDNETEVLDKPAFRAFCAARAKAEAERTPESQHKLVASMNRLLSSVAGVAELQQIEADFEVLNIYRDSIPLDFCQVRNLPLGTLPIYRTKYTNPVGILQGSLAGVGPSHYYATKQAGVQVYPFTISTERIMVPNLNNIYDMEKVQLRRDGLVELDRYLEMGVSNAVLNTVFASPSSVDVVTDDPAVSIQNYAATGGSFAGRNVYVLNPGVLPAGVPTVNYYDLTSEGGLTKTVFQTVSTHGIQIGRNFNRAYISTAATSGNAPVWESLQNMATPVALVAGAGVNTNPAKAVPEDMWNEFQKEDYKGDISVNWFGLSVTFKKQNWLPAGYVIFFSEEPSAIMWDRLTLESGQPADGTLETPADGFYNYKSKSKQIATCRPDFALRNFLMLKVQ